ncbi:trifunctional serine/threonine-protein kinase/ATP-binding protein/SpoIIE family protein phosphatase [Desulfatiferula olefinivorans]
MTQTEYLAGYPLLELIRETRGAAVYRSIHPDLTLPVQVHILKVRRPSATELALFRQEITAVMGFGGQGLVRCRELIETGGRLALVMDDFPGVPLAGLLAGGPLSLDVFLDVAHTLSDTLGHLHQEDLTHKAVTPDHILINMDSGEVRLTGFGAVALLTGENDTLHDPAVIRDILAYISPEQTGRMNRPIDYRTDLYSLGVCFYQMLTGQMPFAAGDVMEVYHAHIARRPLSPAEHDPEIPIVLSDLIMRLLEKAPEDRYQNSFGLAADLQACRDAFRKTGAVPFFEIGRKDVSRRFNIPQKLYGRESETVQLLSCYEKICRGEKVMMVVTGSPGVGKTALIRELDKAIVEKKGYFISGKYEPFRRDVPYSGIIQALMGLCRDILSQERRIIDRWKDAILAAIAPNGRVMTDVLPDLALIIGDQPEVPELEPEESKNRFNQVFVRCIDAFARLEQPMVLFLDDLQWADLPSLTLLERLAAAPEIRHLLVIGAYRDTQMSAGHPLTTILSNIDKSPTQLFFLKLRPLMEFDVRNLIVNFLKTSHEKGALLAGLVYRKTGGNPFFVSQFLKNLFEKKHIAFDPEEGWHWDNAGLMELQVTDNLVDLLVEKINGLSFDTREMLKICACIGNRFDLDMIAAMRNRSIGEILPFVSEAVREGLIGKTARMYVFVHDRIQEAAYSLISDQEKIVLHHTLGRLEYARTAPQDLQNKVFYIVDQLKRGLSLIRDEKEQDDMIGLCLLAGRKAKQSVAYEPAIRYMDTGISLLPPDAWTTRYETAFDLHRDRLECLYLVGRYDEAERLFQQMVSRSRTGLDTARLCALMVILYISRGDYQQARAIGYQGARALGHPLPEHTGVLRQAAFLIRLWVAFRKIPIERIPDLPELRDPALLTYADLIAGIGTVIYYSNPDLFALTVFEGNRITLSHGIWEHADFGLNALGCIVGSALGFYELGERMGRTALVLSERKPGTTNRCRIHFLYAMMIQPWTAHARGSVDYFRKAYHLGQECGDLLFSSHSINLIVMHRLILGDPINAILEEYLGYQEFIVAGTDPFVRSFFEEHLRVLLCMKDETPVRGRLNGEGFDEQAALDGYIRINNPLGEFFLLCPLLRLRYLFGHYGEAFDLSCRLDLMIRNKVGMGCLINAERVLFQSLTLSALYAKASALDKIRYRARLRLNLIRMASWARHAPENFTHAACLIRAEIHRIKGQHSKAVRAYRDAIDLAASSGYLNHEAVARECFARYYLEIGQQDVAGFYLTEACRCYQRLQAPALVAHLMATYPRLIPGDLIERLHPSREKPSTSLDLTTVTKASQAISGEIVLENLLKTLLRITMENAGAQKGFLILVQNGRLRVEASGTSDSPDISVRQSIPLSDHDGLSPGIVNYTIQARTPQILGHAAKIGPFTRDPYVIRHQPKSVLCLPVLNQGQVTAVLYFENNLAPNVFREERIELLTILASQAAIAIDNARLYEHLEDNVRVRTRELHQSLADVEEANRRILDGIRYSALIQKAMLPDMASVRHSLPRSFFIWQPRDIIGGDIYYVEPVASGVVLVVVDCTGHGVPGAFMTILAVTGLRRIIHEDHETDPARILKHLNGFVKNALGPNRSPGNADDGMDAAVCFINSASRQLTFAGAHMPLYLIRNGRFEDIRGDHQSLGYASSDIRFDFTRHTVEASSEPLACYLFSDGFVDQLGGAERRRFGTRRFKECLVAHHAKPFDEQKDELLRALNRHRGTQAYTDDVTVVGFTV